MTRIGTNADILVYFETELKAVELFDMIESVDRLKLAQAISRRAEGAGTVVPVLLEVNVSGEESKAGAAPGAVHDMIGEAAELPGIQVRGLMTMAPIVADPEEARPYFQHLRRLRDALAERFPGEYWQHLSMGMTDDFEVAIEEGATIVRIGRAIFGERRVT